MPQLLWWTMAMTVPSIICLALTPYVVGTTPYSPTACQARRMVLDALGGGETEAWRARSRLVQATFDAEG